MEKENILLDFTRKNFGDFTVRKLMEFNIDNIKGLPFILKNKNTKKKYLLKIIPVIKFEDTLTPTELEFYRFFKENDSSRCVQTIIPKIYKVIENISIETECFNFLKHSFRKLAKSGLIKNNVHLIVTEYINYSDIDSFVENNLEIASHENFWTNLIATVSYNMAYLHDKYNFVHFDLHPANVLVKLQMPRLRQPISKIDFKICDFELSYAQSSLTQFNTENQVIIDYLGENMQFSSEIDTHYFLTTFLTVPNIPTKIVKFIMSFFPLYCLQNDTFNIYPDEIIEIYPEYDIENVTEEHSSLCSMYCSEDGRLNMEYINSITQLCFPNFSDIYKEILIQFENPVNNNVRFR
jgi:hypothetical protein